MSREDEIKQILIDCIYTPDAKPRFINENWVGGDVDVKLKRIDEAVAKIIEVGKPTELERAGDILAGWDEDGLTLQEMIDAIKEHTLQGKGDDFIESIEGVYVWEKLEWELNCFQFLEQVMSYEELTKFYKQINDSNSN